MLSKEEIEQYKKLIDSKEYEANIVEKDLIKYIEQLEIENADLQKSVEQIYSDYQDAGKKMFEYAEQVEQLETNNKKLIEKLEEDIKKNNEFEFMPLQIEKAYNNYYKLGKIDLAQEILEIVKGEKE